MQYLTYATLLLLLVAMKAIAMHSEDVMNTKSEIDSVLTIDHELSEDANQFTLHYKELSGVDRKISE